MAKTIQQILTFALLFLLATWGVLTLLIFFGVPIHTNVLVSGEAQQLIQQACADGNEICRGVRSLWPAITYFFSRLDSVGTYVLVMLALYALYLGYNAFKTGYLRVRTTIKPWHIYLLFVGMVWLLFTTYITQAPPEGFQSMRQIVGPDPQVYQSLTEDGLNAVRSYTDELQNRGCLQVLGTTSNNYEVYNLKHSCTQLFFITRVLSQLLFLTVLTILIIGTGMWCLQRMRYRAQTFFIHTTAAALVGICALVLLLWLLAVIGILNMYVVWALLIALGVLTHKHSKEFLQNMWHTEIELKETWHSLALFSAFLLLSLLALNFLTVVRPFPIGWDDLGAYLNQPRLLTSYGSIIPALGVFKWEYLTALGFLLFGYDSVFGATAALMINWTAGLLAIVAILAFGQKFISKRAAILAALLYYCVPIVGHFSFADMKIDNAVFAFQALALFFALHALTLTDDKSRKRILLALCGLALAFGFAFKPTVAMMIFGVFGLMVGWYTGIFGFLAAACLSFLAFVVQGVFSPTEVLERLGSTMSPQVISIGLLVFTIGLGGYALWRHTSQLTRLGKTLLVVLITAAVVSLPWLIVTNVSQGNIVPKLTFTTKNTLSPQLGVNDLPADLAVDTSHPACTNTGGVEELDRYWGDHDGISHYAFLPWRSVMNTDIQGYYVTSYQYVLLLPLLLLIPWFWRPKQKAVRWLMAVTAFLIIQWIFVGNGVVWYGIGMFAGIAIGLAVLTYEAPKHVRPVLITFLLFSLLSAFSMRMWQFSMQRGMFDYTVGKANARIMAERTIPHYDNVRAEIAELREANPDRPYVYRVGTFIPYFIPQNLEVFGVVDHQLDVFNCLSQEEDYPLALRRLQALGINSIIFDTNTATIERTPGTLHAKVDKFVEFLNTPGLGIQPFVADTSAGIAYFILP